MIGLGIVLLVQAATGSYGVAGAVSAAFMVANARRRDRAGPARRHRSARRVVLTAASVVYGSAMVVLVWSVQGDWPIAVTYVAAALAGAALPADRLVRARPLVLRARRSPTEVQTAFALEAVLDEAVFIVGPILVTVLATTVSPVLGLATAIVAGRGRQPRLRGPAAHRAARAPARPRGRGPAADAVAHRRCPWPSSASPSASCSAPPR